MSRRPQHRLTVARGAERQMNFWLAFGAEEEEDDERIRSITYYHDGDARTFRVFIIVVRTKHDHDYDRGPPPTTAAADDDHDGIRPP